MRRSKNKGVRRVKYPELLIDLNPQHKHRLSLTRKYFKAPESLSVQLNSVWTPIGPKGLRYTAKVANKDQTRFRIICSYALQTPTQQQDR